MVLVRSFSINKIARQFSLLSIIVNLYLCFIYVIFQNHLLVSQHLTRNIKNILSYIKFWKVCTMLGLINIFSLFFKIHIRSLKSSNIVFINKYFTLNCIIIDTYYIFLCISTKKNRWICKYLIVHLIWVTEKLRTLRSLWEKMLPASCFLCNIFENKTCYYYYHYRSMLLLIVN